MGGNFYMLTRVFLDCILLILLILVIHFIHYYVKKYMLEKWIAKAVSAAEQIFDTPKSTKETSLTKKEWVVKFLKDNGLTSGFSDDAVDVLIEAEVSSIPSKPSKPAVTKYILRTNEILSSKKLQNF